VYFECSFCCSALPFGSRKTGYKIFGRYKDCGLQGLSDRSRRPYRHANQLPFQIETLIVQLKKEWPTWGAAKIREKLRRLYPDVHTPAISTVHAVLDRNGLVTRRKRRRYKAEGTQLSSARHPNDLWCADDKPGYLTGFWFYSKFMFIINAIGYILITPKKTG